MKKALSTIPFKGSMEQSDKLAKVIEQMKDQQGCLMPIMQEAQNIYGYLPLEVQKFIAEKLDISVEEVYGVSTFYSMFNLSPKGKYGVSVCMGTACYVKGAQAVLDKVCEELHIRPGECTEDGLFSIEACRCIGACGLAPVMMINGDVYGKLVPEKIPEIIEKYRKMEKNIDSVVDK